MRSSYLLLISISLLWSSLGWTQPARQMIIGHPSIQLDALSTQQLRRIYLARQQFWPTGQKITVVMHKQLSSAHRDFCQDYLNVFPYQIERVWNQLVYSGQAEPPLFRETDSMVIEAVARTPGAIGYINAVDSLPSSVQEIVLGNSSAVEVR